MTPGEHGGQRGSPDRHLFMTLVSEGVVVLLSFTINKKVGGTTGSR